jgi:hypothetical protein
LRHAQKLRGDFPQRISSRHCGIFRIASCTDEPEVNRFATWKPQRRLRHEVRQLARRAGVVVTSGIAVAEMSAVFHRKLREGAIARPVFKTLQGRLAISALSRPGRHPSCRT